MLPIRQRIGLDLVRPVIQDIIDRHPLRSIFWECTLRCNFNCLHCGSDCHQTAATNDMPLEDFLPVLDSIARQRDPHDMMIFVTGGEPLVRKDLEACGKAFTDRGFPWGLVTNGWHMTPDRYKSLLQSGLKTATVSLDGLEETHDWLRGKPGSFHRAVNAIRMITGSGALVFDVVTCVNRRNLHQLDAIRDLLIDCGVKSWRLFTIFPHGRAAGNPELRLTPEELREMLEFIKRTRKEKRIDASHSCEGFLGPYEGEVRDHFFFCSAGTTVGSVLADGTIAACPSIRAGFGQGNIYAGDDFMEVWNTRYQPYRDRSWMKTGDCAKCRYFRYCRGNGMHLRDSDGKLLFCHMQQLSGDAAAIRR